MEKSPAFQFYYKEWITATITMSRMERDIYLLLIIASYDLDGLPDDMNELCRITFAKSKSEKDAVQYLIGKKFTKDGSGLLRNGRMEKVRSNQKSFKQSKSESGKKGAEKRWQKNGTAIVSPMANDSSTTTTTTVNNQQQHAHEDFAKKIFSEESDYDRSQLEIGLKERRLITPEDCVKFNAHLHTEGKFHQHFSSWKSHLRNWLNTKPSENNIGNINQTSSARANTKQGAMDILQIGQLAKDGISEN